MKRFSLFLLFLLALALPVSIGAQDLDPQVSFARGYALYSAGKLAEAEEHFRQGLGGTFPLEDYSLYFLARVAASSGRSEESRRYLTRLKQAFPLSIWSAPADIELAKLSMAEGNYQDAASRLRALRALKLKRELADEALYLLGQLHEILGQPEQAHSFYQELRRLSPLSSWAAAARKEVARLRAEEPLRSALSRIEPLLQEAELLARERDYWEAETIYRQLLTLVSKGPLRPRFLMGLANVLRSARRREEAIPVLAEIINRFPGSREASTALYRLAEIHWNQDENGKALDYFTQLLERYPKGPFSDPAYLASARIHESLGRAREALRLYREFSDKFPDSALGDEARWRLGWIYYLQGDYEQARRSFSRLAARETGRYHAPALYWQARAAQKAGRSEEAREIFLRLLASPEENYYKGPARRWLEKSGDAPVEKAALAPAPAVEPAASLDPERLYHLARAQELSRISLHQLAVAELDEMRNSAANSLDVKRLLMREYARNGAYGRSAILAAQISPATDDIARYRYPLAFWEAIQRVAQDKLDPYLLLALIRQESIFDPRALSPASAYGLMQLLPATAAQAAVELGLPPPEPARLYEPEINLTLGAHHLKELLRRYGNNLVKAIAAYNAGEAAVARWEKQIRAEDEDEFIERIPYAETRQYVKLVLRNHRIYRALYEAKNAKKIAP
jgi:soluble lytic murein transglycosylase